MQQISRRRIIEAPAASIWLALADFGAIGTWAPNVSHVEIITTQSSGEGATRRIKAGPVVLLERVVDWQPEHVLAYEISGLPKTVGRVENRWELRGIENAHSTEVCLTSTVEAPSGPAHQVLAKIATKVLANVSKQLLAGLAAYMGEARYE